MTQRLLLFVVLATVAHCGNDDEGNSPFKKCRADSSAECCIHADCEDTHRCDHTYICSTTPGGEVRCGTSQGSKQCLQECVDDTNCQAGTRCQTLEIAQGSDFLETFQLCN